MSIKTLPNVVRAQAKSGKLVLASMLFVAATAFNVAALPSSASAVAAEAETGATVTKEECKNDGWQALGFRNQGQCIKAAVGAGASGYAGGHSADFGGGVDVNVAGNNNTVSVIVNVIAGRP